MHWLKAFLVLVLCKISSQTNFGVKAAEIDNRNLQRIDLIRCKLRSLRSSISASFCARSLLKNLIYRVLALLVLTGAKEGMPIASAITAAADAKTIIIDPGHGGTDLGARSRSPYCEEKKICLQTARLVKKYLNQLGYKVVMTRNTDAFVSLAKRVEIASQASGDLFLSVHFNSSRTPTAHGIEVFFADSKEDKARTSSSKRLASAVLTRVIRKTSAISRGIKSGNFYVIRENSMPAILVEGGFLSNPNEKGQLRSRDYQEKIARGIADGVDHFLRK